ncbi:MAG TPA: Rdx family protein [Pseudomonadota bacterium]|nr:Rdx family protein [Pseudomonadota bacterium]
MEQETGVAPVLEIGGRGQFDVIADGKLLFSKHKTGRFPESKEILDLLPD